MSQGALLGAQLDADGGLCRSAAGAVLAATPGRPGMAHAAALIAYGGRDFDRAARLLDQAARTAPPCPVLHNDLGVVLLAAGRAAEAAAALRQGLRLQPGLPELHGNLGLALQALGDLDGAAEHLGDAAGVSVSFSVALAEVQAGQGRADDAERLLRQILLDRPGSNAALLALGRLLAAARRPDEACACFDAALLRRPGCVAALCGLADAAPDERLAQIEAALSASGDEVEPADQLIRLRALARLARLRGDVDAEADCLRQALILSPDDVATHVEMAKLLLLTGDFAAGWPAFEWRWRQPRRRLAPRALNRPRWLGEPLQGAAILLHAEQGLGSIIQFARYAPMVAARGGEVVLETPRSLERLMRTLPGVRQVVIAGEAIPRVDWQCPLMSLPAVFDTALSSVPASIPYLSADVAEAVAWRARLPDAGLRIGVAWAGSPLHYNDDRRSMPARALAPLVEFAGACFVSLQPPAPHVAAPPAGVIDVGGELSDLAATAALIAALDLVVTVDTAVAHLAGALGKPVWILLPFAGEYRWLVGRQDSPWYPTARLLRQPAPGDWASVVARAAAELRTLAKAPCR